MSALFSHAIRWEWTERNPITSVRQSAKRHRTPDILTPEEIMAILDRIARPSSDGGRTGRFHRVATGRTHRPSMAGCGLREPCNPCAPFSRDDGPGRSQDGSFRKRCTARRCSSEVTAQTPGRPVRTIAKQIGSLRSPTMKGKQPLWPETLWRRYGRPAVKAAKIEKRVGFHTFRHTYTTLLTQNNEEVKVVQELLRHANSRITLDLYVQAGMPNKRLAQASLFGWSQQGKQPLALLDHIGP